MSAAAASPLQTPTFGRDRNGYTMVPNSIVENQAMLTPAELRLALMISRRGTQWDRHGRRMTFETVTISNQHWREWTALEDRSKELAIKGLAKKCIRMEGRGDKTRFTFDPEKWSGYVTQHARAKARTDQPRKPVAPKLGQKVHPLCRERGCQMLDGESAQEKTLTLIPATNFAQPVAQTGARGQGPGASANKGPISSTTLRNENSQVPSVATPNAQQISQTTAQTSEKIEAAWAGTLAALRSFYPITAIHFLLQLLSVCAAAFKGLTDSELAQAVLIAGRHGLGRQRSAGLFLVTVPEALAHVRKVPKPKPPEDRQALMAVAIDKAVGDLRARGAPFDGFAGRLADLGARILAGKVDLLDEVDPELESIHLGLVLCAKQVIAESEYQAIQARIQRELPKQHPNFDHMTAEQRDNLRRHYLARDVFEALKLPEVRRLLG